MAAAEEKLAVGRLATAVIVPCVAAVEWPNVAPVAGALCCL